MKIVVQPTPEQLSAPRTVIVLGGYRGGTSAVAGLLHWSGIYMGRELGRQYEDIDFHPRRYDGLYRTKQWRQTKKALKAQSSGSPVDIKVQGIQKKLTRLRWSVRLASVLSSLPIPGLKFRTFQQHMLDTIRQRNQEHEVWGWKYPGSVQYLSRVMPHVQNPFFVVVCRNPLDASLSSAKRRQYWDWQLMRATLNHSLRIIKQLETYPDVPCCMLGLEFLKAKPQKATETLSEFLGWTIPEEVTSLFLGKTYLSPKKMEEKLRSLKTKSVDESFWIE